MENQHVSGMATDRILLVAVQYGQADKTRGLLASLKRCVRPLPIDVVIVDNGYHDLGPSNPADIGLVIPEATKELCFETIPSTNLGYFGGANLGLQRFDPTRHRWVIVCNNDLEFDTDFFIRLLATTPPDNGVVVPRIVGSDGEDQNPQYITAIPYHNRLAFAVLFLLPPRLGNLLFNSIYSLVRTRGMRARKLVDNRPREVYLPLGAIFIFPASMLRKLVNLPQVSFLYGEEMLLKRALHGLGGIFWLEPRLEVSHCESSTTRSLDSLRAWRFKREAFFGYWRYYLMGR